MPDEKRIKDFEPATDLLIDDWFAVDSPSQGTRKMQASMFQEGLQTQITTNTENIALHSGQISVLQQGVGNIGDKVDVLDAAITVEEYSATKLYAVDEDCVYEGVRYKCTTAIETPEAFTPSHWQAISIEGELNELNSSLNNKQNKTWTKIFDKSYTTDFATGTSKTITWSDDIFTYNEMVVLIKVDSYQTTLYLPRPLFNAANNIIDIDYNNRQYVYTLQFHLSTETTAIITNPYKAGFTDSQTKVVQIYVR